MSTNSTPSVKFDVSSDASIAQDQQHFLLTAMLIFPDVCKGENATHNAKGDAGTHRKRHFHPVFSEITKTFTTEDRDTDESHRCRFCMDHSAVSSVNEAFSRPLSKKERCTFTCALIEFGYGRKVGLLKGFRLSQQDVGSRGECIDAINEEFRSRRESRLVIHDRQDSLVPGCDGPEIPKEMGSAPSTFSGFGFIRGCKEVLVDTCVS